MGKSKEIELWSVEETKFKFSKHFELAHLLSYVADSEPIFWNLRKLLKLSDEKIWMVNLDTSKLLLETLHLQI